MVSIFEFNDYKPYLSAVETERASFQRGFRSRLAEALECQNAYISQILNTHANFSLEQTLKVSSFLQLNELENKYLVLLVEHARAGTKELRNYFQKDIDELKEKHLNIRERVPTAQNLSPENQSVYYSNSLYPTIHILVTIPGYRTTAKISAALGVDESIINETVLFLISFGLLIEKKGELLPGPTQLHLSKDSPHIRQHHTNWRISAIQSLASNKTSDVHYSTVSSLSLEDAGVLKSKLVQVIQEYVELVRPSKEETLYNFNLDFYSLIKK